MRERRSVDEEKTEAQETRSCEFASSIKCKLDLLLCGIVHFHPGIVSSTFYF